MTAAEYHAKVATFDEDRIQARIDQIPWNVNRAGKHYKKLLQAIRQEYDTR